MDTSVDFPFPWAESNVISQKVKKKSNTSYFSRYYESCTLDSPPWELKEGGTVFRQYPWCPKKKSDEVNKRISQIKFKEGDEWRLCPQTSVALESEEGCGDNYHLVRYILSFELKFKFNS